MEKVFVNFTNHPSGRWCEEQKEAALKYGTIVDIPFPAVDPCEDEAYIERMAAAYVEKIMELHPGEVLCQGEFCLTYQVVRRLQKK